MDFSHWMLVITMVLLATTGALGHTIHLGKLPRKPWIDIHTVIGTTTVVLAIITTISLF